MKATRRAKTGLACLVVLLAGALPPPAAGGASTTGPEPVAPRWNVVLVTIDSLRADRATGPRVEHLAPSIAARGDGASLSPETIATSAWTFPGLVSLFTGMYPAHHGYDARGRRIRDVATLQRLASEAGYRVPTLNWASAVPGLERLEVEERWRRHDDDRPGNLIDWLRSDDARAGPFVAWFHHRGVHLPYGASPELVEGDVPDSPGIDQLRKFVVVPAIFQAFSPADVEPVRRLYDAQIRELDDFWRQVEAALRETGLADRTIVVITADHGEELLDHGLVGHASTTEHARLYDEISRIPLIIDVPGHARVDVPCAASQVDLLPTLVPLLGLTPPDDVDGLDLFSQPARTCDRVLFAESIAGGFQAHDESASWFVWSARGEGHKLIVRRDASGEESREAYDLVADPGEQHDVIGESLPVVDRLAAALDRFVADAGGPDYWIRPLQEGPIAARRSPTVAAPPTVVSPAPDTPVRFGDGTIVGAWTGSPAATYRIEYEIGRGELRTTGSFEVLGNTYRYGPVPPEIWNDLVQFNPWRVRVVPVDAPEMASDWVEFTLAPATTGQ